MVEAVVERLLVTSLQRALEEHAPEELDVFGQWFDPATRETQFHVATVIGAVGYLRRNPALYEKVIETAGRTASARAFNDLSLIERRLIGAMPRFGRARLLKHLLNNGLHSIHRDGRLSIDEDKDRLVVTLTNSLFCLTPAENGGRKRCHFYAALFTGLLEKTDFRCKNVRESACRGQGNESCRFEATPV